MELVVKNPPANAGDIRDAGLTLGLGRSPGGGHGNPAFLPGESHGQRNLAGYDPWGRKESDMTEATEQARIIPERQPRDEFRKITIYKNSGCV